MIGELHVICRPETAAGFRLAGVPVHAARDSEEAAAHLAVLRATNSAGLVLIEDRLHRGLPDTSRKRAGTGLPLVMPFPSPSWREVAADTRIVELLRRAIGYRVRLQ
jgi:vacuolar-type H+-ATPase subunit F/Vma7